MDKILLLPVFLPLAVGFAMLFLPNRLKLLSKFLTLVISVFALAWSVRIFTFEGLSYSLSLLEMGDARLDLLLSGTPLGTFILMFAMGFGVLITLYSLKKEVSNLYFGSILLTIGGSAGILLSNHLLFLLIFWEIVTVSLYLLISTGGRNSNFAATKSFAMIGASDAALLLGVLLTWSLSGKFII